MEGNHRMGMVGVYGPFVCILLEAYVCWCIVHSLLLAVTSILFCRLSLILEQVQ